jgi:hypothetical protein
MDTAKSDRVVFSVLYNESTAFLANYIDNFLGFTGPDEILIVNLQPGREIDSLPRNDRVFLFNGLVRRHKLGHTLLVGHLEAFEFAVRTVGDFGFFCTLASNSLLVRRFDREAAIMMVNASHHETQVDLDHLPGGWWNWLKTINENPVFIDFLRDHWGLRRISLNQIEGLIAPRADWAILHGHLPEITTLGAAIVDGHEFPCEEVLPSTLFITLGSGHYAHICHNFWSRPNGGRVQFDDLLDLPTMYPDHVCAMKWFERSSSSLETAAVTQAWSRELISNAAAAIAVENIDDLLDRRILLEKLVLSLRAREAFRPVSGNWVPGSGSAPRSWMFPARQVQAIRQVMTILTSGDCPAHEATAHVYFENTKHDLQLEVMLTEDDATRVRIACRGPSAADDMSPSFPHEGHLYVSLRRGSGTCTFRMRVPLSVTTEQEAAMRRIVIFNGKQYRRLAARHVCDVAAWREYYFRHEQSVDAGDVWFGIPFFMNMTFDGLLDVVQEPNRLIFG